MHLHLMSDIFVYSHGHHEGTVVHFLVLDSLYACHGEYLTTRGLLLSSENTGGFVCSSALSYCRYRNGQIKGVGIAQWVERRTSDRNVPSPAGQNAGGRLQINTHILLTYRRRIRLTMHFRHDVGSGKRAQTHVVEERFVRSLLSSLNLCGLILT